MKSEKLVLGLICDELDPSGFYIDDSFGSWKVRRLYETEDGIRYSTTWYSNVYYREGVAVRVFADWVGEEMMSLANPQFGANLRSFLNRSWEMHLGEMKGRMSNGFSG